MLKKTNLNKELDKEEYSKVKAVIKEMILKAIPKELADEVTQKRYENPAEIMLMIMVKYQPGTRKEKEAYENMFTYTSGKNVNTVTCK
jgi:hypothetical protein